jgi:hypothetical protein
VRVIYKWYRTHAEDENKKDEKKDQQGTIPIPISIPIPIPKKDTNKFV